MFQMLTGLRKRVSSLAAKRVAYQIAGKWIPAITSHLYHVIQHTEPGPYRIEWWKSCLNHICGIHEHSTDIFPKCLHGPDEEKVNSKGETLVIGYLASGEYKYFAILLQIVTSQLLTPSSLFLTCLPR